MKTNTFKLTLVAIAALSMSTLFQSCKKSSSDNPAEEPTEATFAVGGALLNPSGMYLTQTGALSSGEISFAGNGADVTTKAPGFLAFIQKNGFYYSFLNNASTLTKYSFDNQSLNVVKVIPFVLTDGFRYSHTWIDDKTLMIYGNTGAYKVVNVETMAVTMDGNLNLPLKTGLTKPRVGFAEVKDNKLYVGYSYADESYPASVKYPELTNYATSMSYFAVYDYPAITNVKYSEDGRSTSPGNDRNGVFKTFVYNDDLYVMTSPLPLIGQNYDLPTGIFRFKKGATAVDATYFFDISAKLNGDPVLGGGYAGNGKVVVRRIRMDLHTDWNSFSQKNIQEYHVIDLVANTITKLNIPLSKSMTTAANFLVDNTKVYFPVNTVDVDGNFNIYNYDGATGTLTKGLQVKNIDQVQFLSRVK